MREEGNQRHSRERGNPVGARHAAPLLYDVNLVIWLLYWCGNRNCIV